MSVTQGKPALREAANQTLSKREKIIFFTQAINFQC